MKLVKKWLHVVRLPQIRWQKLNKDEKGLTLIELLAVIVILGIIAAIAIPSVNSIIKNTEAKAQSANAEHFIATAKLAIADRSFNDIGEEYTGFSSSKLENAQDKEVSVRKITLQHLVDGGYLEESNLEDPQSGEYDLDNSYVVAAMLETQSQQGQYTVNWQYFINLQASSETGGKTYYEEVPEKDI